MTDNELPFSSSYEKLDHPVFPTIRRRDKYGNVGDRVSVTVEGEPRCEARIIAKEKRSVKEMATDFLVYDTDTVNREKAWNVLNSFYRNPIKPDEELTQYVLLKVA